MTYQEREKEYWERVNRRWRELVNAEESPGLADDIARVLALKPGEQILEERPNPFDGVATCIPEADSVWLHDYNPETGLVAGEPFDSKTSTSYSILMISSLDQAVLCRFPLIVSDEEVDLQQALEAAGRHTGIPAPTAPEAPVTGAGAEGVESAAAR